MKKNVKLIVVICACCAAYSAAWIQQDIRYKNKLCVIHMRMRMITSRVFEDMLPLFVSNHDKKTFDVFAKDALPAMVDYLMLGMSSHIYCEWDYKWATHYYQQQGKMSMEQSK